MVTTMLHGHAARLHSYDLLAQAFGLHREPGRDDTMAGECASPGQQLLCAGESVTLRRSKKPGTTSDPAAAAFTGGALG